MARLTQIDNQGNWRINGLPWSETYEGKVITKNTREKMYGAFYKLLNYEDTGIDPEQLSAIDEEYSKMAKELAELRKVFMETEHEAVLRLSEGGKMVYDIMRRRFVKSTKYQWRCPMCYSQVGLRIVGDGSIEDKDIKHTCPKCGWNIDWERVINEERDD